MINCPDCRGGITAQRKECKSCRGSGCLDRPTASQIGIGALAALLLFVLLIIIILRP